MGLPWVRLDSNIASHDKILNLLTDPSPLKWQAFASYMCALGWSGGQGTDGKIPNSALGFVHANGKTARLLVKYSLWREGIAGYKIVNFEDRQQVEKVAETIRAAQSEGGKRGNCIRYHGELCWKNGRCSRDRAS